MRTLRLLLLVSSVLLLAACNRPAVQQPASGSTPPLADPQPTRELALTVVPTATPVPDYTAVLYDAVAKTNALRSFQVKMYMDTRLIKGDDRTHVEQIGRAEASGQFADQKLSMLATLFDPSGETARFELLVIEQDMYVRSGTENEDLQALPRYHSRIEQESSATTPNPQAVREVFSGMQMIKNFTYTGPLQLAQQTCANYLLSGADIEQIPEVQEFFTQFTSAGMEVKPELHLRPCANNLIHQIVVKMAIINDAEERTFEIELVMDLFDFNGDILIERPTNVREAAELSEIFEFSATVYNGGNVRREPISGQTLDQIHAHELVSLLGRNDDGSWYLIRNPRGVTGWVSATLLTIDPVVAAQVPVVPETPISEDGMPLHLVSSVINGGNLREQPRIEPANVIGQVCPGDQVEWLRLSSRPDRWAYVRILSTPLDCHPERVVEGTEGWLSTSLLSPPVETADLP